jgi:hypothetical protein
MARHRRPKINPLLRGGVVMPGVAIVWCYDRGGEGHHGSPSLVLWWC